MPGQIDSMRRLFPALAHRSWGVWEGEIAPTPLSERYRIRIVYRPHEPPRVHVIAPVLVPDEDGKVPHTYRDMLGRPYPCLYDPRKFEWQKSMSIAETIVPWTALWLTYYEHWRATGDWLGGGDHPQPEGPLKRRARRKQRRQGRRAVTPQIPRSADTDPINPADSPSSR